MKFRFTWIIFLLIAFVPFEVLFLKYLPVSDAIYGYLRFAVEIIIYLLGGLLLIRFIQLKKIPAGTSIDKLLILFVVYAVVITFVNNAPFFQSFMGLRTLLRYIPLFYVLAIIHQDQKTVRQIFKLMIGLTTIQVGVTIYQHYFGLSPFWYPRASDLEIGGKQVSYRVLATGFGSGREMGAGIGTFGDSVFLALFLVIVFVILGAALQKRVGLPKNQRIFCFVLLILVTISIFFTYSRGSVFVSLAAIPLLFYFSGARKKLVLYGSIALLLISPIIFTGVFSSSGGNSTTAYINPKLKYTDPLSNITAVFSSSYMDNTMQFSRGLVLTEIGGNLISSFKILGYSPAQEFALEKAATKLFGSNTPINNLPIINDVYWVAFIIYYGIAGLVLFYLILYKIFAASMLVFRQSPDPYFRLFALAMAVLVIVAIPYSLILRTFVFRSFGFYFWMIAGLVFSEWRRLKQEQRKLAANHLSN